MYSLLTRVLSIRAIKEGEESFLDEWPHKTERNFCSDTTLLAIPTYTYHTTTSFELHEYIPRMNNKYKHEHLNIKSVSLFL